MAIVITTAVVAATGADEPQYNITDKSQSISVSLKMNGDEKFSSSNGYLYPMIGKLKLNNGLAENNNILNKMVTVSNNADAVFVRVIFAFETGGFASLDDFHEAFYINIDSNNWSWPDNDKWFPIIIDGESYYMVSAVYNRTLLTGETTEPSLLQVGLYYKANEDTMLTYADDDFKIHAVAQAIPASVLSMDTFSADTVNSEFNRTFNDMSEGKQPSWAKINIINSN